MAIERAARDVKPRLSAPPLRVLVFAKAPRPGRVKTRLAGRLGARGAAKLHRRLVTDTLTRVCTGPWPVELWCAPHVNDAFFLACRRRFGVRLRRQTGAGLGVRMHRAFLCTAREQAVAVLIGGDGAALGAAEIAAAEQALRAGRDAVFAPTPDGGYLLVALRSPAARLFRPELRWGGAQVWRATRARLRWLGLSEHEIAGQWDVDRIGDWRRWRRLRAAAADE